MYIDHTGYGYCTSSGEQRHSRAPFLMLVMPESDNGSCNPSNVRGIVRKVALRQLGHWMMGKARVNGHTLSVSGAYGADGLIMDVPDDVFALGTPIPADLFEAWSKGGGHNSCGSEAEAMRRWALTISPYHTK